MPHTNLDFQSIKDKAATALNPSAPAPGARGAGGAYGLWIDPHAAGGHSDQNTEEYAYPPAPAPWTHPPHQSHWAAPQTPWSAPCLPPWDAKRIEEAKIEMDNEIQAKIYSAKRDNEIQAKIYSERAEQSEAFASGVEQAQGALGARHHLRQALSAGHKMGLLRCWAAACERGFQKELLEAGKSETLMAASLGANPKNAIEWLADQGFKPGPILASMALLTALCADKPSLAGLAALAGLFEAGTLDKDSLSALHRLDKGLGARVFANGEAFELRSQAREAQAHPARPKRL